MGGRIEENKLTTPKSAPTFVIANLGFAADSSALSTAAGGEERFALHAKQYPGSTVVFYFSGHGSQAFDKNDTTGTGFHQTLVAYDSRREGGSDILDDEINAQLEELRKHTDRITLIFDSCHSGSVWKDIATMTSRSLPPNPFVSLPQGTVDTEKPGSKHAPKEGNRRTLTDPYAVAAIRLLILTGARLREILDAQWEHVDIERGVIFLADSKTGRKPVYLSAAALEVLAGLPRIEGNPYIVPGEKAGRPKSDLKRPWAAICKSAGLEGVRLHDLRHSFASIGAGASMGLPVIGKLLGHSQATTTHRYAHLDADPLRRAVDTIGATITAAMNGKKHASVVPIRKTGSEPAA